MPHHIIIGHGFAVFHVRGIFQLERNGFFCVGRAVNAQLVRLARTAHRAERAKPDGKKQKRNDKEDKRSK